MPDQIDIVKEILIKWQKIINNDEISKQKLLILLKNIENKNNIVEIEEDSNHMWWKREHYENREIFSFLIWYKWHFHGCPSKQHFTQTSVKEAVKDILSVLQQ